MQIDVKTRRLVLENPAAPIFMKLEGLRKGLKMGRPMWPKGACVYFIGAGDGFVKIGFSTNVTSRVCDIQGANPQPLKVLALVPGGRELESEYHRRFKDARHFYEWFRLTPEIEAEIARLNSGDSQ